MRRVPLFHFVYLRNWRRLLLAIVVVAVVLASIGSGSSRSSSSSAVFVQGLTMLQMTTQSAAAAAASRSPKRQSVAVIGGGMAGLACAERLVAAKSSSYDVTVFDTGRLRPGGRCSSRQPNDTDADDTTTGSNHQHRGGGILSHYRYDHAAQILTVPNTRTASSSDDVDGKSKSYLSDFARQVKDWERRGIVTKFPNSSLYNIRSHKNMEPILESTNNKNNMVYYYGTRGMGSIIEAIVSNASGGANFQLKQDVWVSPSNGVKYIRKTNNNSSKDPAAAADSPSWKVQAKGKVLGTYDALVIAHNGKCADRLMSRTPAKALHRLLRVNFAANVANHGGKRMTLNSIYSLTFALRSNPKNLLTNNLPASFVGGFVNNHPYLTFLTCQTRKYPREYSKNDVGGVEVWTVLSSASFAKKHKAPQEFLPEEVVSDVSRLLLDAVEEAVTGTKLNGNDTSGTGNWLSNAVLDQRLQLWGAALPLNVWQIASNDDDGKGGRAEPAGYLYDAEHRVGACGDWLVEASLAGAWTSGRLLADHMIRSMDTSHGLDETGSFAKSESTAQAGIGALPVTTRVKRTWRPSSKTASRR